MFKKEINSILKKQFCIEVNSKDIEIDNLMIDTIYLGLNLLYNKEIDKDELFLLEKIIDDLPFKKIKIQDKLKFQRFYSKFKEYCVSRYLEDLI